MFRFIVLVFTLFSLSLAWDINNEHDRAKCQAYSRNPLDGCDTRKTLLVSPQAKYHTVQSAIASLPNNTETYILLIASGNYTEQVNITRRGPTYLLGATAHPKSQAKNTVNIIWRATTLTGQDNAFSSTLTIAPTLNASLTGSGPTGFPVPPGTPFGCVDFRSYNLNFVNDFLNYAISPSLALSISYANGGFYYTGFYSYQDTIYVGKLGNAYFANSEVAGQTDFFYGFGTAWVQSSSILLRSCGGGITAWKGTNTTFVNKYGVYIVDSAVRAANATIGAAIKGKCPLGPPWNAQHRSIFARTYLDASILPAGYIDWGGTPRYSNLTLQAEYRDFGPGFNASARAVAKFDVQLSDRAWAPYSEPRKVFITPQGKLSSEWIDFGV